MRVNNYCVPAEISRPLAYVCKIDNSQTFTSKMYKLRTGTINYC